MTSEKDNKKPSTHQWMTVVRQNAAQKQVEVKAKASLRWWTSFGEFHTKGVVRLERFPNTALFRICFYNTESKVSDVLYLPSSAPMEVHRSLLESKHTCAHGIRVEFGSGAIDSMTKLQLVIPTNDTATNISGLLFGDALEFAESERLRFRGVEKKD